MKKMLLVLTLLSSSFLTIYQVAAYVEKMSIFGDLLDLQKMEHDHENECLDFKREYSAKFFDLMKKHGNEEAQIQNTTMKSLDQGNDIEEVLLNKYNKKIALDEKKLEEWKALCEAHQKAGQRLYMSAKTKLDELKPLIDEQKPLKLKMN